MTTSTPGVSIFTPAQDPNAAPSPYAMPPPQPAANQYHQTPNLPSGCTYHQHHLLYFQSCYEIYIAVQSIECCRPLSVAVQSTVLFGDSI